MAKGRIGSTILFVGNRVRASYIQLAKLISFQRNVCHLMGLSVRDRSTTLNCLIYPNFQPPKLLSFSQTGNDGVEQPVAMKEEGKLVGRGDQDTNCPINTRHLGDKEKGKVARAGRPLNMADRYKILALYEGGHKISHIAKIVGVTHSCVSKIMSRYSDMCVLCRGCPGIVGRARCVPGRPEFPRARATRTCRRPAR